MVRRRDGRGEKLARRAGARRGVLGTARGVEGGEEEKRKSGRRSEGGRLLNACDANFFKSPLGPRHSHEIPSNIRRTAAARLLIEPHDAAHAQTPPALHPISGQRCLRRVCSLRIRRGCFSHPPAKTTVVLTKFPSIAHRGPLSGPCANSVTDNTPCSGERRGVDRQTRRRGRLMLQNTTFI